MFQDSTLFPHLSVADNVAFGLLARNGARAAALTEANEWLDRLGLRSFTDAKPAQLSGGQTQLVSLARTLITEPNLLLLDEPLAALDVTARAELPFTSWRITWTGSAGARLLINHDPTEAFLLADQIAVVEDGAITQEGTADDIRLQPRTPYVADLAGSNLHPRVRQRRSRDGGQARDPDRQLDNCRSGGWRPCTRGPFRCTLIDQVGVLVTVGRP